MLNVEWLSSILDARFLILEFGILNLEFSQFIEKRFH